LLTTVIKVPASWRYLAVGKPGGKTNLRRTTKPLREINGITYAYLAGIDLIRPNFEVRKLCLPIDRGKGTVYSVVTRADANATDPWLVKAGVKDLPSAAEIDFAVSMKIVRGARVLIPDIRHVAADIAGRQIEGSTECYGGMSKVAADAIATLDDVRSREIRAARERRYSILRCSQLMIPRTLSIPWGR